MSITYLKRAVKTAETEAGNAQTVVTEMLTAIEAGGERTVRDYAQKLDGWIGPIVVSPEESIDAHPNASIRAQRYRFCCRSCSSFRAGAARKHPRFLHSFCLDRWRDNALRRSTSPAATSRRVAMPHRIGLYVHSNCQGGGVNTIVACSTPFKVEGIHPYVLYAMKIAGVDIVMTLGGVEAIAAMAFGLFTEKPADVIVEPGNKYVAEAKRTLFGKVGIDVLRRAPSEIAIPIADASADPEIVAADSAVRSGGARS